MDLAPVEKQTRITSLDSLRGFALLGIFLVNMISFHSPYLYYNPYDWWDAYKDFQNFQWIDVFVQASFYPLFAMMFGYGAAMQRERAAGKGLSYPVIGTRRFAFLLLIGIIHAFLIWSGDILINYAIFGFILLLFLRLSGKLLLVIGSILLFVPNVFLGILLLLMAQTDPISVTFWTDISSISKSIAAYGSGDYFEVTKQRLADWLSVNAPSGFMLQVISIFPHLLIGAGAQKIGVISRWSRHPKRTFIIFISFFASGYVLKSLPIWFEQNVANFFIQDSIGGPLLAISYAALIIGLSATRAAVIFKPFTAAGRMSLTNYLLQSVICTFIFYSYGLGFYGQITLTTGIWLVLAIFACQAVLSEVWLAKFERGPVEKLWRFATYGKNKENKGEKSYETS